MLRRLYVDNFKSLVNFDLELKPLCLLMGPNGSGKSTVFEVLASLRDFVSGQYGYGPLFGSLTRTRWQDNPIQTLELVTDDAVERPAVYSYRVEIEHSADGSGAHVLSERLLHNDKPLYQSQLTEWGLKGKLYRDDHTAGPEALVDSSRSALPSLQPRPDNRKLIRFREHMANIIVVRPNPFGMEGWSDTESPNLDLFARNLTSWLRYMTQQHLAFSEELARLLREAISDFATMGLPPFGQNGRALQVSLATETEKNRTSRPVAYNLIELSEGQRTIILLNALVAALRSSGADWTLCVDEPDNFIGLREIQPWLNLVMDSIETSACQAVLISHHPEMINQLAMSHGVWIERTHGGPSRVMPVSEDGTGLPPSELVARGWLNA